MGRVGHVPAVMSVSPPNMYSWTPVAPLQWGTTYYWQVVSLTNATPKNASMIAVSSVQSFVTAAVGTLPPTPPADPVPMAGATGVGTTVMLTWVSSGASSYSINFGPTNPPPQVASGLTTATYVPPGLAKATTYFWQVLANNAAGTTNGPVWSFTTGTRPPTSRPVSDFDGDGRSDAGIFRPTAAPNPLWYVPLSGGGAPFQIYFGTSGDIPVPGDYDGDGKADAVIWRPSTGLWYGPRTGAATIVVQLLLGQTGDIPVPCDYDGDGAIDPAIYRPSTGLWFGTRADGQAVVLNTNLGFQPGDIPVPADYDGDGRCDPAIMRPGVGPGGTNLWYALLSGGGVFQIYFGAVGDIPVPADYDGDGKADAVIFRPSTALWYGPRTDAAEIVTQMILGQGGVIPIPGDYDGNGATDPAFYDPRTGFFYGVNAAGNTVVLNTTLGAVAGDIPTAKRPEQ
jgi:hypothetical protein